MSYELCFTEEFFTGSEETGITDYPTSILEAIENMPRAEKIDIAMDLLKAKTRDIACIMVDTECFAWEILKIARETNSCDDLRSPIKVYLDSEFTYSVDVYEKMS